MALFLQKVLVIHELVHVNFLVILIAIFVPFTGHVCLDLVSDPAGEAQIKYEHLLRCLRRKPRLVERVELNARYVRFTIPMIQRQRHDRLLVVVGLARIAQLNLILCRVNELMFAIGHPANRVDIVRNIRECGMPRSDNFRAHT